MPNMARRRKPVPEAAGNPWPGVLFALRELKSWEQSEAAAQVGASMRTWGRWENGKVIPDGTSAFALRCLLSLHAPKLLKKLPK